MPAATQTNVLRIDTQDCIRSNGFGAWLSNTAHATSTRLDTNAWRRLTITIDATVPNWTKRVAMFRVRVESCVGAPACGPRAKVLG